MQRSKNETASSAKAGPPSKSLKEVKLKERIVFKPVLASPFSLEFPRLNDPNSIKAEKFPAENSSSFFAEVEQNWIKTLLDSLLPIGESARRRYLQTSRTAKFAISKADSASGKTKSKEIDAKDGMDLDSTNKDENNLIETSSPLNRGVLIGHRAITRFLKEASNSKPKIRLLLICKGDFPTRKSSHAIEHFLPLLHSYNRQLQDMSFEGAVLWAPTSAGLSTQLASACGIPRCNVLAILDPAEKKDCDQETETSNHGKRLTNFVQEVTSFLKPWEVPSLNEEAVQIYKKPRIEKQISTRI